MLSVLSKVLIVGLFVLFLISPSFVNNKKDLFSVATTTLSTATTTSKDTFNKNVATSTDAPKLQTKPNETITKTPVKTETKPSLSPIISSSTLPSLLPNISPKETKPDFSMINEKVRNSLVNILCNTSGSDLSPITGSGVIVSADGVILTNAHIAQYLLLKDFNGQKDYVECVIRTGSPAYPAYKAKLVYLSPDWIANNKTILIDKNPKGTGEFDYSFLKVTEKIDKSPISNFPFIKISLDENIKVGSDVILGSYPAGFLGGIAVIQYLYQSTALGKIADIFTFKESTIDLISVPGTILSQKGSSGGVVVNTSGEIVGLISTSGDGEATADRDLRAITGVYINRDILRVTGGDMSSLVSNADSVSNVFTTKTAPILEKILTDAILGK